MRRLAVLVLFVLASFLPALLDAGRHVAKGFASPDGTFHADGEISPDNGSGPSSAFSVDVDTFRLRFAASLGGTVEPGSLGVALAWSATWFDDDGKPHRGQEGGLDGADTRMTIDSVRGIVEADRSAALLQARGPARLGRACGMGIESRAHHVIRFRRGGEDYTLRVTVLFTRRGNRVVTIDDGPAP